MTETPKPPALSATIAKILLNQSPWHAWWNHYDLNPQFVREEKREFDLGTAAHALLLQSGDPEAISKIQVVDAANYRTKAAQEKRDAIYAAGRTPVLLHQLQEVRLMVASCHEQLAQHQEASDAFTNGLPEHRLEWYEGDVRCKARLDWLMNDKRRIFDYKSINQSASPDRLSRSIFNDGLDIQAAMYIRGVKAVYGVDATFQAVFQETNLPHAITVIGFDPAALALAAAKLWFAISKWSDCLRTNTWPGYPTRTCYVEMPAWQEAAWLEQEQRG